MSGANERLGLPFGTMQKVLIAVDVDGTLIDSGPIYYEAVIKWLQMMPKFKNVKLIVWSGGGKDYAERWVRLLGLEDVVWRAASKTEWKAFQEQGYTIIAVDDIQDTSIGTVNMIVRNK